MKKRIGVFGGTFDPPHLGHISLAIEMLEAHHLSEVWFCPAKISPFKQNKIMAAPHHREAMIKRAIRGIQGLKYCSIDLQRPAPSYTVDTLRLLHQHFSGKEHSVVLYLIMGEDSAQTFFDWHQPQEILELSTVIIGQRTDKDPKHRVADALIPGMTPIRSIDISSSEIRRRIQAGKHVEHLLPTSVWRYIQLHRLYNINKGVNEKGII